MSITIFEDRRVESLYPVTVGRPAFATTCGGMRLVDQLKHVGAPLRAAVRPHLKDIVQQDFPELLNGDAPGSVNTLTLLVNARLVPSVSARRQLEGLPDEGRPGIVRDTSGISAVLLPQGTAPSEISLEPANVERYLESISLEELSAKLPLIEWPHDFVRHHLASIEANSMAHVGSGQFRQLSDGVFLGEGAILGQHVITDASRGPIIIDRGASIGPFSYLRGPVYIGPGARVTEHSALKDGVSVGHTSKIGGEVEASIIEPFTNKQHHGFLGHSYLGSWVNLGAGTCNSDLKNTYGIVKMEYGGQKISTDMQFVGAIVGDYAKTAINTGIFTGKTIGVCSMVYGFVTTNVPSFVNYARLFGQVTTAPVEVMVATQARMFARRKVNQRPCDVQHMHELTHHEREVGEFPPEPLSL